MLAYMIPLCASAARPGLFADPGAPGQGAMPAGPAALDTLYVNATSPAVLLASGDGDPVLRGRRC